jgi:WD40 repeat protein
VANDTETDSADIRRGDRVADCAGLENRGATHHPIDVTTNSSTSSNIDPESDSAVLASCLALLNQKSPDLALIAERWVKAEVIRWDISSRRRIALFYLTPLHVTVAKLGSITPLRLVTILRNGETIAAIGADRRSVELWDVAAGKKTATLAGFLPGNGSILALAVSPDDRELAIAVAESFKGPDGTSQTRVRVVLWDINSQAQIKSWPIFSGPEDLPHGEGVYSMAFCPGSRTLAIGGSRGDVDLWHIQTGRKMLTMPSHTDHSAVTTLLFSPTGKTLAVGTMRGSGSLALYHASGMQK